MGRKELLIKHIEEERKKLNAMLTGGAQVGEIYHQSVVVDKLIEQYISTK